MTGGDGDVVDELQRYSRRVAAEASGELATDIPGHAGNIRERSDIARKKRVASFRVWLSDKHTETFNYADVNGISASPAALVIRLPWWNVTAEGRGLFLLEEQVRLCFAEEIKLAASDTTQEWALTSLRIYTRDTSCTIDDNGQLSVTEENG